MSRRDFAAHCVAGVAALRVGSMNTMQRAAIPSSGEQIGRIGLGTWQTFDVGDDRERRGQLAATLDVLIETGGSVVDTSPMYGTAQQVLGDLQAEKRRDNLFVATKVWTTGAANGTAQMQESMAKLRITRADLMQIHNLQDWRVHLRTLRRWKEEGRVRYIGITHYVASAYDQLARIIRDEPLDFVQANLSLEEPEAAGQLLPLCAKRSVAFLANRPFGGGGAFARVRATQLPEWAAGDGVASWAQFQLKWLLSHEEVTCAIPGTGSPRHMLDNAQAARGAPLDVRARSRYADWWRTALGSNS